MSTRHSFLSTTGLIRPASSMSTTSIAESYMPQHHVRTGGTKSGRKPQKEAPEPLKPLTTRAGIVPLGPTFIVGIAVALSILFILVMTCAFIPDEEEKPAFADMLDNVAANTPGIVLIGDDVDVDVDEPSLSVRWSIIACGQDYMLSGSAGTHGSKNCGLPAMPLQIFVDGEESPTVIYNPSVLPTLSGSSQRHGIQNMFQFDDDHVLDVHQARLYPFDTYYLTSTYRALSMVDNQTVPIQKLATISLTSSFVSISDDASSTVQTTDGTELPSRDLAMQVYRPAEARAFALLLFGISWMFAHGAIALIALCWNTEDAERVVKHLALVLLAIFSIPQLRNAMPDAPGYDGVLIDAIGFFPQMLICGVSAIFLFAMMVRRELQRLDDSSPPDECRKEAPAPLSTGLMRMRRGGASVDISHLRNFSRSLSGFGRPH